jgi:TolA-binding protein
MVSRELSRSSKAIAMSDYYLNSTDSDNSSVNSDDESPVYDMAASIYKVNKPSKGVRNRHVGNESSINDPLDDISEFHPLDPTSNQTEAKKSIDLVKMYTSRKQKEEDLKKYPSTRIDELEEELAHLKIEIAMLNQENEVAIHESKKTSKENNMLRAELELMKERESGYVAKINDLTKRWLRPKQGLSVSSITSNSSPVSVESSKFAIAQIDTSSLKTQLEESNSVNEKLEKDLEKMKNQLAELQRKEDLNYVHTVEDEGDKKEFRWMDNMFSRKNVPVRRGVEDLLWSQSTRTGFNSGEKQDRYS